MSNEKEQANKQNEAVNQEQQPQRSPSSSSHSQSRSASSSRSHSQDHASDSKQETSQIQCCKVCKHPDKSKRACVCVVPLSQRRADLGTGCRNCGCTGCSKEDFISKGEDPEYHPEPKDQPKPRRPEPPKKEEKRPQRRRDRSNSRKKNRSPRRISRNSESRSRSPEYIDSASMKFYNFDRSLIGGMIINEYQLNPILLGFGVPQRTYSYVFGRPK